VPFSKIKIRSCESCTSEADTVLCFSDLIAVHSLGGVGNCVTYTYDRQCHSSADVGVNVCLSCVDLTVEIFVQSTTRRVHNLLTLFPLHARFQKTYKDRIVIRCEERAFKVQLSGNPANNKQGYGYTAGHQVNLLRVTADCGSTGTLQGRASKKTIHSNWREATMNRSAPTLLILLPSFLSLFLAAAMLFSCNLSTS
jgi:hypothetical protein